MMEEEMITQPTILALGIQWREEPGGLQSAESQKSQTRLVTEHAHKKGNQLVTKQTKTAHSFGRRIRVMYVEETVLFCG